MRQYKLDPEEEQILKDFEEGKFVSIKNLEKEKKRLQEIAVYTLAKKKNINIRLSENDLLKLKKKAMETGIPYQTLVGAVLHKFANNEKGIEISL